MKLHIKKKEFPYRTPETVRYFDALKWALVKGKFSLQYFKNISFNLCIFNLLPNKVLRQFSFFYTVGKEIRSYPFSSFAF